MSNDSLKPMYDSANPLYDTEYNIAYDAIYHDNSRIPTRSNECGKNKITGSSSFICEFYKHSKYFCLYLVLMLVTLTVVLCIILIIPDN
jgi:hypothetical protein